MKLKDVIHLYLGCELFTGTGRVILLAVQIEKIPCTDFKIAVLNGSETYLTELGDKKPILRPLSSMTKEEISYVAWINMDSERHLAHDSRISKEDIDINIVPGSNEFPIIAEITCICFDGVMKIRPNGDISITDTDHDYMPIERLSENVLYLLKQGFDLFGLIESNQAIDKTKPVNNG